VASGQAPETSTRSIVCLDGPLAGAQLSAPAGDTVVLYDGQGNEVVYRLDGLLSVFPGGLYAARRCLE